MSTILLVDDDKDILASVKSFLARGGFTNVLTASDGIEALNVFQSNQIDLIISDINMPTCDGIQLVKNIRKLPGTEFLPIIYLSARTSAQHQREGFQSGADNYICKPIERSQRPVFLEMIKSSIERANRQKEKLELSLKDPLTGLYRRDTFFNNVKQFTLASNTNGSSFCIAILDIDHFKKVNDTYGHSTGDTILKEFTNAISTSLRENVDQLFRYGGEEFVVILTNVNSLEALSILERVRSRVKETKYINNIPVTFSAGVMEIFQGDIEHLDFYVECADKALYEAKTAGRDKIIKYNHIPSKKEAS